MNRAQRRAQERRGFAAGPAGNSFGDLVGMGFLEAVPADPRPLTREKTAGTAQPSAAKEMMWVL
jgi:hypothetical protein